MTIENDICLACGTTYEPNSVLMCGICHCRGCSNSIEFCDCQPLTTEEIITAITSRKNHAQATMEEFLARGMRDSAEMWERVYHQFLGLEYDLQEIKRKKQVNA